MRVAPLFVVACALASAVAVSSAACTVQSNDAPLPPRDAGPDGEAGALPDAGTDAGAAETGAEAGASIVWPTITLNGGGTMAPMKLVTIVAGNDGDKAALFAFGDAVAASQWWKSFSDDYALGAVAGHTKWTGPDITGAAISDVQMIQYIRDAITANSGPAPDAHTLYLIYLPEGTSSSDSNTGEVNTDCASSSGYHTITSDSTKMIWSVVERCPQSTAGWTKLQGVTQTAAHEIAEAATNPDVATGWDVLCAPGKKPWECTVWATATQGEVGDLCPETRWDEGGFVWSRIWSKSAAAAGGDPCVPKLAQPFFNVTTANEWYPIPAGTDLMIPVTGWATDATPAWKVITSIAKKKSAGVFAAELPTQTMSVGQSAALKVTAPATAVAGDYAIVLVGSAPTSLGTYDPLHEYYVGVYVP